jgi:hypothetical protein
MDWGSLLPLFSSEAAIPGSSSSKQSKSHPLESTTYEMQILQAFSFDIHTKWSGVGGFHA